MSSFAKMMGANTAYNEDIRAYYVAPKEEYLFQEEVERSNYTKSAQEMKKAYQEAVNKKLRDEIDPNEPSLPPTYWQTDRMFFKGKDGTSDAYTKRGKDLEFDEYMERQLTQKQAWRLETSNTYIDFVAGGKVFIGDDEYIIIKVINQLGVGNIPNFLKVRNNPRTLNNWGVKTLILA